MSRAGDLDETTSHVESLGSASTTASRRARLQIQLQRLDEEQAIQKKKAALEVEAEFTRKKYEALEASIADDSASVRSRISKGKSDKQVRDWVEKLNVPIGDGNRVAGDDDGELEGAVGGVMEKLDPEKDQVKFNPALPAAAKPVDIERSKESDHPRKGKPSTPEDVEYLRRMLEQYKTLYLAEKEKNRQQPSVPEIGGSKGAYPKMKPAENSHDRPTSSTPKLIGERQDDPEKLHKLMSHSATDGLGEGVQNTLA